MMRLDGNFGMVFVLEPGNISNLKTGGFITLCPGVILAFTPDPNALLEKLGILARMPLKDEPVGHFDFDAPIDRTVLNEALAKCRELPEVDRR